MWKENHFKLFVSHLTTNGETVHKLNEALEKYHISCFVAHDDIEPTRQWQDEIEDALRSMDALAALITPNFYESKWCDQEVGYAMGSGRLVLPIRFGADPHGFIGKYQGYTIKEGVSYVQIAKDILGILSRNPVTSRRIALALAYRLKESWSFDSARDAMDLIEECPVIQEEALLIIESAKENGQVSSSWGVSSRINTLIKNQRQIGNADQGGVSQ